jgi:hypothetical protein
MNIWENTEIKNESQEKNVHLRHCVTPPPAEDIGEAYFVKREA